MRATSLTISLAILPTLVSAGLFRQGGPVKMLQDNVFRKSLKSDRTAIVAFVAPWCGHCQKLTPEFTKAAQSLSPLIDFYAVDCDEDQNKRLCAEQGIKGFPTIKSFPRGATGVVKDYPGERTASSIVSWANGEVPMRVTGLKTVDAVKEWAKSRASVPRVLLLTTQLKVPVLWKVLASRYYDDKTKSKAVEFGAIKDEQGDVARALGLTTAAGEKSKVALWKHGDESVPTLYDGVLKFEPLSSAFDVLQAEETTKRSPKEDL